MKILADKHEFAKMIRECQKIRDRNCGRCQCVLQENCVDWDKVSGIMDEKCFRWGKRLMAERENQNE